MRSQDTANNEVAEGHGQGSIDQERSSSDLVHKEEHDRGENDEQSVLHSASDEVDVTREARHGKDVYDVVCVFCQ